MSLHSRCWRDQACAACCVVATWRWVLDGQLHLVKPLGLEDEFQQRVARPRPCRELQRVQSRHLHPRGVCVHLGCASCSEALVSTHRQMTRSRWLLGDDTTKRIPSWRQICIISRRSACILQCTAF